MKLLPQSVLAFVYITGFYFILYIMFVGDVAIHEGLKDAAIYLLGILSHGMAQIMSFFFGSSVGSKSKERPQ